MKKIILALLLLSSYAQATLPGSSNSVANGFNMVKTSTGINTFTVPIASLSAMTLLCGGTTSVSSASYFGFYSQSAPTLTSMSFQVPSGKTFYALQADFAFSNPDNATTFGYGTTTLGQEASSNPPPTGNVRFQTTAPGNVTAYDEQVGSRSMTGVLFPAGSYPYIEWISGTSSSVFHVCLTGIVQ